MDKVTLDSGRGIDLGHRQLLLPRYDDLADPPEPPQPTCWQRCRGRMVSLLGAGGSLALRLLNLGHVSNAIGSFGTGFFSQASISSGFEGKNLARIRQVCLTTFGQLTLFYLSQGFANTKNEQVQELLTHAIIAELGANVDIVAAWLYEQGAVRVESQSLPTAAGEKFKQLSCINQNLAHALKLLVAGGCGAIHFLTDDPVLKGLTSFGAFFFTFQVVGERLIIRVNIQIDKHSSQGSDLSLDGRIGTRYRIAKTALTTVALIVIPLCFIPYTANPDTPDRLRQLALVGGLTGISDGIIHESQMARLKNIPVKKLDEFRKIDSLEDEEPAERCIPLRHLAARVGMLLVPIYAVGGMVGFVVWQEVDVLKDANSKIALGTMLGGFLTTYGLCNVVDWTWNPNVRHYWRDKLMTFILVSPRIFGINPLYVYLAGTNALRMDNRAIESQESRLHLAAIIISWGSYGFATARELHTTSTNRIGTLLTKYPFLAIANGAITTKLSMVGVNP